MLGKVIDRVQGCLFEVDLMEGRGKSGTQEGANGNDSGEAFILTGI